MRHHSFSHSSLCKVTSKQAPRNLLIEALGGQYSCSLTMGVLDGQSILVFAWEPGVDERLPAIVDAIAVLVGGSELLEDET